MSTLDAADDGRDLRFAQRSGIPLPPGAGEQFADEEILTLTDYLRILRRHRVLIALVTLVVVAGTVAVSLLRTPEYRASAELLVEPFQRIEEASLDDLAGGDAGIETVRRLITAVEVRDVVAGRIGLSPDDTRLTELEVTSLANTRILTLTSTGTDPLLVANIATTYAEAYLDVRRDRVLREVTAARDVLDDQIDELERSVIELDRALEQRREDGGAVGALQLDRDVQFSRLSRLLEQRAALVEDGAELSSGGQVLSAAQVPTTPFRPQPLRDGLLAVLVGLAVGVGIALLRDHLDDRVRDELDLRRATGMRPLLGRIPAYDNGDKLMRRGAISVVDPNSIASESYRELSTNLRFLLTPAGGASIRGEEGRARSIMVVSASADDGKTATAVNLAIVAARAGQRVILVDADLRRPSVNASLGLGRLRGLTDTSLAQQPVTDALVAVGVDGLRFLPAGTIPPNPADFLAGPGMQQVHRQLETICDLIIYDTPAALAVPDALEVGRLVDGAILVLGHERSTRREIVAAVERLEQVGVPVLGTVMNQIRTGSDTYYYYYSYYYSSGYVGATPTNGVAGMNGAATNGAAGNGAAGSAAGGSIGLGASGAGDRPRRRFRRPGGRGRS